MEGERKGGARIINRKGNREERKKKIDREKRKGVREKRKGG